MPLAGFTQQRAGYSLEQCSLTGGRLSSFAISVFLICPASSRLRPLTRSVMYDDDAMADPQPKVLNLTSEIMPLETNVSYLFMRVRKGHRVGHRDHRRGKQKSERNKPSLFVNTNLKLHDISTSTIHTKFFVSFIYNLRLTVNLRGCADKPSSNILIRLGHRPNLQAHSINTDSTSLVAHKDSHFSASHSAK